MHRAWRYIAFMRPRAFAATFALAATGYAASPSRPSSPVAIALDLLLLFVVHDVLLWGGTNAFNSSQDRDTGPVNFLTDPPPMPPRLAAFGLACKAGAVALAALRGPRVAALVAAAALLSIWYSARIPGVRRAKEIGGLDVTIHALGCGVGSILLGYCMTPAPLDLRILLVGLGFSLAIFGGVPTAQIFQLQPSDDYATARNYTSLLGACRTLRLGPVFFALHLLVLGALVHGGFPGATSPRQLALLGGWAVLVGAAAVHSLHWSAHPFRDPYRRMLRQMVMLMTSQVLWTAAAWGSRPA